MQDTYLGSPMHTLDIATHHCQQHTYGDQTLVRDDCVLAYIDAELLSDRVAITSQHPAARVATLYFNHLTVAEVTLARDLRRNQ